MLMEDKKITHNFMELSSYSLKEEINIILESQAIETFFLTLNFFQNYPKNAFWGNLGEITNLNNP